MQHWRVQIRPEAENLKFDGLGIGEGREGNRCEQGCRKRISSEGTKFHSKGQDCISSRGTKTQGKDWAGRVRDQGTWRFWNGKVPRVQAPERTSSRGTKIAVEGQGFLAVAPTYGG